MADPFLKFYTSNWRSDPALKMCSMAARGLWIEMICLMHEATPYGHLLVSSRSPTDSQLAVLVGAPSDQIPELVGELESAGVFSRTKEGVIYSRRLTRMQKKAATARKNGHKGGNPTLSRQREKPPLDNPPDKGRDKTQKPEARNQSKKGEANASPKKNRGDRLSEDWVLPKDWGDWAIGQGFDEEFIRREADKFRDYWIAQPGQKGVKLDWYATWRNWVRNNSKPMTPQHLKTIPGGRNDRRSDRKSESAALDETIRRVGTGEIQLGSGQWDPW